MVDHSKVWVGCIPADVSEGEFILAMDTMNVPMWRVVWWGGRPNPGRPMCAILTHTDGEDAYQCIKKLRRRLAHGCDGGSPSWRRGAGGLSDPKQPVPWHLEVEETSRVSV